MTAPRQGRQNIRRPSGVKAFDRAIRWLTPPANFRGASGSKERPFFKVVAVRPAVLPAHGGVGLTGTTRNFSGPV